MIDNIRFTNSQFENINNNMKIYVNRYAYPLPELKYLQSMGGVFEIIAGCWGTKNNINIEDLDLEHKTFDGVRLYAKYVGMCDSTSLSTSNYIKIDRASAELYSSMVNVSNSIKWFCTQQSTSYKNMLGCDGGDNCKSDHIGIMTYTTELKSLYKMPHFTSFITAYVRIQLLEQIRLMDFSKIIKVVSDGIYTTEYNFKMIDIF